MINILREIMQIVNMYGFYIIRYESFLTFFVDAAVRNTMCSNHTIEFDSKLANPPFYFSRTLPVTNQIKIPIDKTFPNELSFLSKSVLLVNYIILAKGPGVAHGEKNINFEKNLFSLYLTY